MWVEVLTALILAAFTHWQQISMWKVEDIDTPRRCGTDPIPTSEHPDPDCRVHDAGEVWGVIVVLDNNLNTPEIDRGKCNWK